MVEMKAKFDSHLSKMEVKLSSCISSQHSSPLILDVPLIESVLPEQVIAKLFCEQKVQMMSEQI